MSKSGLSRYYKVSVEEETLETFSLPSATYFLASRMYLDWEEEKALGSKLRADKKVEVTRGRVHGAIALIEEDTENDPL